MYSAHHSHWNGGSHVHYLGEIVAHDETAVSVVVSVWGRDGGYAMIGNFRKK